MSPGRPYQHRPIGEEIRAIGGMYTIFKEMRMLWSGRELLVTVGASHYDTACCGVGGCGFADVAGFIVRWRFAPGISEVEPVLDPQQREAIAQAIKDREKVLEVRFAD